nr:thiamine phosphate synthase [Aquibacillus albus]
MPIAADIHPFVTAIHIREKHRTDKEIAEWVERLLDHKIPSNKIIINSRAHIVNEYNLGGVQLSGQQGSPNNTKEKYPSLRVGVSIHHLSEVEDYQENGADYLLFGNVFETTCKPGLPGKGTNLLEEIIEHASIPVIGIGGIKPSQIPELLHLGLKGIAVMSGVLEAPDPLRAVKDYYEAIKGKHIPQG